MRKGPSCIVRQLVPAVLFAAAACGTGSTEPTVHLVVRTDKAAYSLSTDTVAQTVLLNLGPNPVYAPMNEYVYAQRLSGETWIDTQPWFTVDGVGVSIEVAAGDSLIAMPMIFDYVGRRPGVYRFLFEVAYDSLGHRLVPEAARASAPFELRQ